MKFRYNHARNDNLIRLGIDLEIDNEFNRSFTLNLRFLKADRTTTHEHLLNIPENTLFNPLGHEIDIDIERTPSFLETKFLAITFTIGSSSTPLDPNVLQTLKFKSAGTYYLKI